MKKKWTWILSVALALAMVLTACGSNSGNNAGGGSSSGTQGSSSGGGGGQSSGKKTTVNVMFMEQSAAEALEKLAADFTAQNPDIEIKFQYTPNSQYKGVIRPQLLSGEGPDLFMVYNDLASFAEDLSGREWAGRLIPSVREGMLIQGKLVQMPMTAAGYAVFYNKEIFEQLNLQVPTTYDGLVQVAEAIKQAGITPFAMGMMDGFVPNSALAQFLTSFYANMPSDYYRQLWAGEAKISENADFKAGLEKFMEFHDKGFFPEGVLAAGYEAVYQDVASGKAAMIIQGTWLPGFTSGMNPDLKLGSFIMPNPTGGESAALLYPDWNLGINKNSKNKEAAGKFLDFIAQKENIEYLDAEWIAVPAFADVEVDLGEAMQGYLDGLSKYTVYQPWYPNVADPNYEFVKVITDLMSGKVTIDEALKSYDSILEQNKASLDAMFKES
jgi:raffinose/stachyose/melibiose transport system substrate-binding protein